MCHSPAVRVLLTAVLLLAGAAIPSRARAQWSTSPSTGVQANVSVVSVLTGGALQNLDFGVIVPGDSAIVAAASGGIPNEAAGKWEISFNAGINSVVVAFVLPTELVNTTNATARLPVSWNGSSYAAMCEVDSSAGTCGNVQTFNPSLYQYGSSGGYSYALLQKKNTKSARVYLGGAAKPGSSTVPGTYQATVTLRFYTTTK